MTACPTCGRPVPSGALFCHADGRAVGEGNADSFRRFRNPLILPTGRPCGSFDELVTALLDDWVTGCRMLRDGDLEAFLAGMGRPDLAREAREAAGFPDADVGLDQFLRALPGNVLRPAELLATPAGIDLGRLRVGDERAFDIELRNVGMGLLHGTARSRVPWLVLGDGVSQQRFAFEESHVLTVRLRGGDLRASPRAVEGRIVLETSGGTVALTVTVEVPPVSFAAGVLAGARTPRELAAKAKANPPDAARHFESGAVARWYAANGWPYPVEGDPATGLAAVQQFFDALGLSRPPRLQVSEAAVSLQGRPGESVRHELRLWTPDKRPLYARAHGDKGWLHVRGVDLEGTAVVIHLAVPCVPDWPGETATATVTIHANCRQRIDVPVTLRVPGPAPTLPPPLPKPRRALPWVAMAVAAGMLMLAGGIVAGAILLSTRSPERPQQEQHAETEKPPPDRPPPDRPPPDKAPPNKVPPDRAPLRPRPPIRALREFSSRPVEVVFCIDTTGSMGELLKSATARIWSMCSRIAAGTPTPELRVGIVAYRDRGDEYVTRVIPLTRDLDAIHAELEKLRAAGGGDEPESVNQALDDAIHKIRWSDDRTVMKLIFLVGDAPPHMDYSDDVKYPATCAKAVEKGITINAVQCGDSQQCRRYWRDIADKGGGEFVALPAASALDLTTPLDAELAALGETLYSTVLPFGPRKVEGERMLDAARRLTGAKAADRVAFAARSYPLAPHDLLDAVRAKRVKLAELKEDELPDALKGVKTAEERQRLLLELDVRREKLRGEILALEQKRATIQKERLAREGGRMSFDGEVLRIIRRQAKAFGVAY